MLVYQQVFPLHRAVAAANISRLKFEIHSYLQLIIGEITLGICFYIVALIMLKNMEIVAIKKASLEIF